VLLVVPLSSERASQAVRQDSSCASRSLPNALLIVVLSDEGVRFSV
jgi:hypothetical protein